MKYWGKHRTLIHARHRSWDVNKVGLGPPLIETSEGWLIIYHGARITASGGFYRIALALLDLQTLQIMHRSKDWVFAPKERYEMVGDVDNIIFPCGAVVDPKTR